MGRGVYSRGTITRKQRSQGGSKTTMGAHDATLTEALKELRDKWNLEVEAVLAGKYSLWLGSGISGERLPRLSDLLRNRILAPLQLKVDPANAACPFRRVLNEIIELTTVKGLDPTTPVHLWNGGDLDRLLDELAGKYADVLDKDVREYGIGRDLFWEVLGLQKVYADPGTQPDAEHTFLCLLVYEGILTDLVTTNWDPLIEVADENSRQGTTRALKIVACNEELDGSRDGGSARLLKIHGCARKASDDPDKYRPFLVTKRSQINAWSKDKVHEPMRVHVEALLREKPAFFIGLSGQDFNLQAEYVTASLERRPFPVCPTRVLFSEPRITASQQAILKAIYTDAEYRAHPDEIDGRAALPLYAKPLLGSLYLLTLRKKLELFLARGAGDMEAWQRTLVTNWLAEIEQGLCTRYDAIADLNERWRQLAREVPRSITRFLCLYRREELPRTPDAYEALCPNDLEHMAIDPGLPLSNTHWLVLTIALITAGHNRGLWSVSLLTTEGGERGQLIIIISGRAIRVFVLRDPVGLAQLEMQGFVDPSDANDVLIVYPRHPTPSRRRRSPRRGSLPARRAAADVAQVGLNDLLGHASTAADAVEALKLEIMGVKGSVC